MQGDSAPEDQIKSLLDMGFSRDQATEALSHCQNSVVLAVDWLIAHPSSSPPPQQPPQQPSSQAIIFPPHPIPIPIPIPIPNPPPIQQPQPQPSSSSLGVQVEYNILKIGNHLCITFERTLRVPDDGKIYPLPPSLGQFPVLRVDDYLHRVPDSWRTTGGVFIPLFQREACFIQFHGNHNHPCALKVAVGKVNAISGQSWNQQLLPNQNDYVCVPDQPWLDGINNGNGTIKQFVAMPLGKGYTVEAQVTGKEVFGGFQILCFDSKTRVPDKWHPYRDAPVASTASLMSGLKHSKKSAAATAPTSESNFLFNNMQEQLSDTLEEMEMEMNEEEAEHAPAPAPTMLRHPVASSIGGSAAPFSSAPLPTQASERTRESPPPPPSSIPKHQAQRPQVQGAREMGLAAGGKIKQAIFADPYGIDSWDQSKFGRVFVHIVNSQMWTQITGQQPPDTPISAQTYSSQGYPWFDLYEEDSSTVPASSTLSGVKSVKQVDQEKYAWPQQDDSSIQLSGSQVHQLPGKSPDPHHSVRDGSW